MSRICDTCNIEIKEDKYMKDGTVCKSCCKKTEKNTNDNLIQNQQPKIVETMTTTLAFQRMKITPMLLSVQETLVKLNICSKC